ncbi:histone H3.v1-like [Acropora millepora]|uniref:histone H3.v1-like n=1 Tax=Acropora millepora TaxID=45264 RepID=UPI001CF49EE1|nr:histone H3.v1-like [Acropora millepora]
MKTLILLAVVAFVLSTAHVHLRSNDYIEESDTGLQLKEIGNDFTVEHFGSESESVDEDEDSGEEEYELKEEEEEDDGDDDCSKDGEEEEEEDAREDDNDEVDEVENGRAEYKAMQKIADPLAFPFPTPIPPRRRGGLRRTRKPRRRPCRRRGGRPRRRSRRFRD